MHVSAFGTDTRGKIEIDTALFARATLVVDDVAQANAIGRDPTRGRRRARDGPTGARRRWARSWPADRRGRTRADEITLFDATGLAFQDLVAGSIAMRWLV